MASYSQSFLHRASTSRCVGFTLGYGFDVGLTVLTNALKSTLISWMYLIGLPLFERFFDFSIMYTTAMVGGVKFKQNLIGVARIMRPSVAGT